jgi:hypothetical protein
MISLVRHSNRGHRLAMNAMRLIYSMMIRLLRHMKVVGLFTIAMLIYMITHILNAIQDEFNDGSVAFGMAFPVCTDMAVSGAAHFAKKLEANPSFQDEAVSYAMWCAKLFNSLNVPFFVENPVSVLATKWRKPNYTFHPYLYGGYIPLCQAEHPEWPQYIAARDAYPKKTCLWTGNGFVMPSFRPVSVEDGYC